MYSMQPLTHPIFPDAHAMCGAVGGTPRPLLHGEALGGCQIWLSLNFSACTDYRWFAVWSHLLLSSLNLSCFSAKPGPWEECQLRLLSKKPASFWEGTERRAWSCSCDAGAGSHSRLHACAALPRCRQAMNEVFTNAARSCSLLAEGCPAAPRGASWVPQGQAGCRWRWVTCGGQRGSSSLLSSFDGLPRVRNQIQLREDSVASP